MKVNPLSKRVGGSSESFQATAPFFFFFISDKKRKEMLPFSKVVSTCVLLFSVPCLSSAFYLPGVAPHDYQIGEQVTLHVNSLTPSNLGKSVISYDFYNPQFHFCPPKDGALEQPESIGSILFGDRIFNSPFEVHFLLMSLLLDLHF
jgi:hypothetical protein